MRNKKQAYYVYIVFYIDDLLNPKQVLSVHWINKQTTEVYQKCFYYFLISIAKTHAPT